MESSSSVTPASTPSLGNYPTDSSTPAAQQGSSSGGPSNGDSVSYSPQASAATPGTPSPSSGPSNASATAPSTASTPTPATAATPTSNGSADADTAHNPQTGWSNANPAQDALPYTDTDDRVGDPASSGRQHAGQCAFDAAVNAISTYVGGGQQLASLVKPVAGTENNADGPNYHVQLPGDQDHGTYTVTPQQLQAPWLSSGSATTRVLEVAGDQAMQFEAGRSDTPDQQSVFTGGRAGYAMTLLTGKAYDETWLNDNINGGDLKGSVDNNDIKSAIVSGLAAKQPVTVRTSQYDTAENKQFGGHIMSVNSYDPKTNLVTFSNSNSVNPAERYTQDLDAFMQGPMQATGDAGSIQEDGKAYTHVRLLPISGAAVGTNTPGAAWDGVATSGTYSHGSKPPVRLADALPFMTDGG